MPREKYIVRRVSATDEFQLLASDDDVVGTASAAIVDDILTLASVHLDADIQGEKLCTAFVTSVLRKVLGTTSAPPLYARVRLTDEYHGAPNACYTKAFGVVGYMPDSASNLPFIFKRVRERPLRVASIGGDALASQVLARVLDDATVQAEARVSSELVFLHDARRGVVVETGQREHVYAIAHSMNDFVQLTRNDQFIAGIRGMLVRLHGVDAIAVEEGGTIIKFIVKE